MSYYPMKLTQPANAGVTWGSGNTNTNTSQPAFCAYPSGDIANVTGDGTIYVCVLNTTIVNRGSSFNTANGVFTAPVTGLYQFDATHSSFNYAAGHTAYALAFAYNGTFTAISQINAVPIIPPGTVITISGSILRQMTAGDTMSLNFYCGSSTKTIYMQGFYVNTRFSGFLMS